MLLAWVAGAARACAQLLHGRRALASGPAFAASSRPVARVPTFLLLARRRQKPAARTGID
jgi:hypothetical protein